MAPEILNKHKIIWVIQAGRHLCTWAGLLERCPGSGGGWSI